MSLPRLAIVSVVRNEADIIETFVRHHASMTSRMVFVLHRCIDNTGEILLKLQGEGISMEIHETLNLGHMQSSILSSHIRKMVAEGEVDWIAPLDADEFLVAAEGRNVLDVLAASGTDRVQTIAWKTYVPTPEDDIAESNPIRRIVHRKNPELPPFRKVLLPVPLLKATPWNLPMGSHEIFHGVTGEILPSIASATLALAHFPVRSAEQITAKILGGCIALAITPSCDLRRCYHWQALAKSLATGRPISISELRNIALRYAVPDGVPAIPGLLRDPVPTETGRPRLQIVRVHPIAVLMDAATASTERLAEYQRMEEQSSEGESEFSVFTLDMQKGIERLQGPLQDAMKEGVIGGAVSEDPHASALVCGLALVSASLATSEQVGSALTRRQRLASALPPFPGNLQWICSLLATNKLPSTLENAIQEIMRVLATADMAAHCQQCRREDASDDLLLALAARIKGHDRPATPLPLATFLAQTIHQMLTSDGGIPMGLSDARVHIIDAACGRGEIAGEVLRRTVNARLEHGANPDQLRRDILGRMHFHEYSPVLRSVASLRLSLMLDTLRIPLVEGESLPITVKEPIEETFMVKKDVIPVVCTALMGEMRIKALSREAKEILAHYVRSLRRSGMDRDVGTSQVLMAIAEAHARLKHTERGVAAFIAPRWILHASAAAGMREMLLQDFEQVRILDLHGQTTNDDVAGNIGDEPVVGADPSGTCILMLIRAPDAVQRTLFMEWKGLRLQKYHALLSQEARTLPWKVIAPEKPGYVFLPA